MSLVSLATFGALLIKEYLRLRPFHQILSVCKAIHSTASVLVWRRQWSKNTVLCSENESVLFGWPWKQLWSFLFSWSSTVSFCRFNTRFSHYSSCSQLYRLPVYLLFERDSYFGRETKRRLQTHFNVLLASLALTDLLTGFVVQPFHGAMTIFLLQRKSFHEFCGVNLVFSISFVVTWHTVLGHSDLISGERYLTIKYAFAHNEMLTKTRVIVLSVWRLDPRHSWLLFFFLGIVLKATLYSSIICLQILLCKEARRHEKWILDLQFQKRTENLKVNYFSNNI